MMQSYNAKKPKKRLSIIFRDLNEIPHRKGKDKHNSILLFIFLIKYFHYLGVNSILVDS